jgi:DNA-binding winged helix-turn-helix (wHTH) protein
VPCPAHTPELSGVAAKRTRPLECLVGRSGVVVGRDELRQAVWGKKHGSEHGPKQCIRELRVLFEDTAAIGVDPSTIFSQNKGRP